MAPRQALPTANSSLVTSNGDNTCGRFPVGQRRSALSAMRAVTCPRKHQDRLGNPAASGSSIGHAEKVGRRRWSTARRHQPRARPGDGGGLHLAVPPARPGRAYVAPIEPCGDAVIFDRIPGGPTSLGDRDRADRSLNLRQRGGDAVEQTVEHRGLPAWVEDLATIAIAADDFVLDGRHSAALALIWPEQAGERCSCGDHHGWPVRCARRTGSAGLATS